MKGIDSQLVFFLDKANHLAIDAALATVVLKLHLCSEYDRGSWVGEAWHDEHGDGVYTLCTNLSIIQPPVFNPLYSLAQCQCVEDALLRPVAKRDHHLSDHHLSDHLNNFVEVSAHLSLSYGETANPLLLHIFTILVSFGMIDAVIDEAMRWLAKTPV